MKLNQISLITLLTSISIANGYASLGRKVDKSSIPEGVCKIEIQQLGSGQVTHCTGSVIGDKLIKTAAHCFEDFQPKAVICGNDELRTDFSIERFPSYNHDEMVRGEENRWQDHILLKFNRSLGVTPFTLVDEQEKLVELIPTFKNCLMSGYGGFENNFKKTGVLNGTLFSPDYLDIREGTIYVNGQFLFELIPGDSGGALLCHDGESWYDLGSASAHDWDNQSIYAANFSVKSWLTQFEVNRIAQPFLKPWPRHIPASATTIEVGHIYQLRPYSQVISDSGSRLYNGDNEYNNIEVIEVIGDKALGILFPSGASQYYLCMPNFICYQNREVVTVRLKDLFK